MPTTPLSTIRRANLGDCKRKGIVLAKDWFPDHPAYVGSMYANFYVVVTWFEYDAGTPSSPAIWRDGGTTIAMCASLDHAIPIFNSIIS